MQKTKLKVIPGGRKPWGKLWLRLFSIGIIVLAGFLLWNSLGYISLLAARRTVASHTVVKHFVPVQCIVVRDELIVKAPADGQYIPLVANGARVRVGQIFARVEGSGGTVELTAERAGLICHGSDGLEGMLTVNNPLSPEIRDLAAEFSGARPPKIPEHCVKGQTIAVIVNNSGFQLLTKLDFHTEGKKRTLAVELADGTVREIAVTPRDVFLYDSVYWVLWDAPVLPEELGLQRAISAQMINGTQKLVVVPEGALYTKDEVRGVFVLYRNEPVFNPVEELWSSPGWVGVSGLADGQVVLSLPKWASYAKRWWQR